MSVSELRINYRYIVLNYIFFPQKLLEYIPFISCILVITLSSHNFGIELSVYLLYIEQYIFVSNAFNCVLNF